MNKEEWFNLYNMQITISSFVLTMIITFFKQNKLRMIINFIITLYVMIVIGYSIGSNEVYYIFLIAACIFLMFLALIGNNVFEIVKTMDVSLKHIN